MKKIIVGMSGGVDSSVAALRLQQQGFEVAGLFMKNWEEDDTQNYCSAAQDVQDAQAVCDKLNIPLYTVNFSSDYWDNVFEHCLQEYQAGRTPNPDILCNREIKFKVFLAHALRLGGEAIATGHYARVQRREGQYLLLKGLDPNKDQSYFLYTLGQQALEKSLFPIGELHKNQVRDIAATAHLATSTKKDSTGICFIGERPFKQFLERFLPAQPGDMVTPDGITVGKHDGMMFYTLGQRQGLHIGGMVNSTGKPWYVVGKDIKNNRLVVAQGHQHPLLFSHGLFAEQLSWVTTPPATLPHACSAKTRYRQPDQACSIERWTETGCRVHFQQPQRAVTPGQSIVFYHEDCCLGGGIITSTF